MRYAIKQAVPFGQSPCEGDALRAIALFVARRERRGTLVTWSMNIGDKVRKLARRQPVQAALGLVSCLLEHVFCLSNVRLINA